MYHHAQSPRLQTCGANTLSTELRPQPDDMFRQRCQTLRDLQPCAYRCPKVLLAVPCSPQAVVQSQRTRGLYLNKASLFSMMHSQIKPVMSEFK